MSNSKKLVIVESPSKAKKIQEVLGSNYKVLASMGHIVELGKGGKFGIGVDVNDNFRPKYVLMEDKYDTLDKLLKASKECDQIIIASDPDREGEAIGWHLKERLEGCDKPFTRVKFSELTKTEIKKAINNTMDLDINLFHSQEARRILDRLVGFMASPFLMAFFGDKLSAGRVQSVVTKMIVEREKEIDAFVPEEFWTASVSLSKDMKLAFDAKYSKKITDQVTADKVKASLNDDFIVHSVDSGQESKPVPAPMITSSLQRIMSKDHGMSPDKTMKAAQSLYESGLCTYIRTDSFRASEEAIISARDFLKSKTLPIPAKPNTFKNKDSAQDAHECIRPTDLSIDPSNEIADLDQRKVYEVIKDYFLASQMTPAIFTTLKVVMKAKKDKSCEVVASGKAIKSPGYLELLGSNENTKISIPLLEKNDELTLIGKSPIRIEKKKTQPPPRYSIDVLLKMLEDKKIGRPSTYADLVAKIATRNYVEMSGNVFHPTALGIKINDILNKYFSFMDYKYTAKMEEQLDIVANGKLSHKDMLKDFYSSFKDEINKAYLDQGSTLCEKCNSAMVVRTAKVSGDKFLSCSAYPACKNTKSLKK